MKSPEFFQIYNDAVDAKIAIDRLLETMEGHPEYQSVFGPKPDERTELRNQALNALIKLGLRKVVVDTIIVELNKSERT
jgi:hypothetical protein